MKFEIPLVPGYGSIIGKYFTLTKCPLVGALFVNEVSFVVGIPIRRRVGCTARYTHREQSKTSNRTLRPLHVLASRNQK